MEPYILPLDSKLLQKSTLGKLSRTKIREAFEKQAYHAHQKLNDEAMAKYRADTFERPTNGTEECIFKAFQNAFDIPLHELGVNADLFEMGITSIDLIKVKQMLQIELNIEDIPILTVMTNPSIRTLAEALQSLQKPHEYNPMVVLQKRGSKIPLWLVHPGTGEVLAYMYLASHFTDRPIYGLRARGLQKGEPYFASIPEIVNVYHQKIKWVQPQGPYAIAGYSFGSIVAFEMAKLFNSHGEEVKFLGAFDMSPGVTFPVPDRANCLLIFAFPIGLLTEEQSLIISSKLQSLSPDEQFRQTMDLASKQRMAELDQNLEKLKEWGDLVFSLLRLAVHYAPIGTVASIDVFCATPPDVWGMNKESWKKEHLEKWADFSAEPRYHNVEGVHHTIVDSEYAFTFQRTLKAALAARGI